MESPASPESDINLTVVNGVLKDSTLSTSLIHMLTADISLTRQHVSG